MFESYRCKVQFLSWRIIRLFKTFSCLIFIFHEGFVRLRPSLSPILRSVFRQRSFGLRQGFSPPLSFAFRNYTRNASPNPSSQEVFLPDDAEPTITAPNVDSISHYEMIEPTSSDIVMETALKIGDLKAMGLIHNTPVGAVEALLEAVHVYTGLPWWSTIVFTTFAMRMLFLPLIVNSQRNTIKLITLQPKIEQLMEDFKKAKNSGDSSLMMRKHQQVREFYTENKISPWKNLYLIVLQTPVMISFFLAVKKMAEFPVPGFESGGALWFQNLTIPDPYYILPLLMSATFIAMMETSDASRINTPKAQAMKWAFRGVTVISIPVAMSLSSSVHMYLMSSTIFSVLQSVLMNNKTIRRYLDLPAMPQMLKKPEKKPFQEYLKQWNSDVRKNIREQQKKPERL